MTVAAGESGWPKSLTPYGILPPREPAQPERIRAPASNAATPIRRGAADAAAVRAGLWPPGRFSRFIDTDSPDSANCKRNPLPIAPRRSRRFGPAAAADRTKVVELQRLFSFGENP